MYCWHPCSRLSPGSSAYLLSQVAHTLPRGSVLLGRGVLRAPAGQQPLAVPHDLTPCTGMDLQHASREPFRLPLDDEGLWRPECGESWAGLAAVTDTVEATGRCINMNVHNDRVHHLDAAVAATAAA